MLTQLTNVFEKVYLTIRFDALNSWLYCNWLGEQTLPGIMVGADACLEMLAKNDCAYLLNDHREVVGPWDHAVDWMVTTWLPEATGQGLTHLANVVSPEATLSAQRMHLRLHGHLQIRLFDNIAEAQTWLRDEQTLAASAASQPQFSIA